MASIILIFIFGIFRCGFLLTISLMLLSSKKGFQIDILENRVRSYISIFGFRKGEWIGMGNFPFLCIKKKVKQEEIEIWGSRLDQEYVAYEIWLLTNNHQEYLIVKTLLELDEAQQFVEAYSKKLNKLVVSLKNEDDAIEEAESQLVEVEWSEKFVV
ncbi:MAG: hypothetical protein NT084_02285 [Bacteroidetes bacterium]|nr:hypothetical protein [Bacteroidota bacterium]